MPRPGVDIISRAAPPARGTPSDTGAWFVVGLAERGPVDRAVEIRNMTEFGQYFGARQTYSNLYDALETYFREGGARAFVARVAGPAATKDTVTLNDGTAAPAIAVDSLGGGATELSVDVVAGGAAGSYVLVVKENGVEIERSPDLLDNTAAVSWAAASPYVRVRSLGANDPAVIANAPLAGGNDDRAAIDDTHRTTALTLFGKTLGPGQVSIPGATTSAVHTALIDHARTNNRFALLDAADTSSNTTLAAAADAVRSASTGESWGALFGPWITVPGIVRGTTRTVPPSALAAGLIARRDSQTGNPNDPAAGAGGEAMFALGLSQNDFADATRTALNEKGVNLFRMVYGSVRLYGYRTLVGYGEPWLGIGEARTRMAITAEGDRAAENFTFAQIDGRGRKVSEFVGALTGILQRFHTIGALYGEDASEAFSVDAGPTVNTPQTLANQELRAVLSVRTSPFAELVTIEIVKVPITESL